LHFDGGTFTVLGAPEAHHYVLGGEPTDPGAGTVLDYAELAAAFGTQVPTPERPAQSATILGPVQADGTIGGMAALPREATLWLSEGNSGIIITGYYTQVIDRGGADSYTLAPTLMRDVTLIDSQPSRINLPEATALTAVQVLAEGLALHLDGGIVTVLGAAEAHRYVLGSDPADPNAGTVLTGAELAAAFAETHSAASLQTLGDPGAWLSDGMML
jgi:hypothetical protein